MKRTARRNPTGYRQPGEKPTETRPTAASMEHYCGGNGEPCMDGIHIEKDRRRRSIACQRRGNKIRPGDETVVAYWRNKPTLTIHCAECAEEYLGVRKETRKPCKSTAPSGSN